MGEPQVLDPDELGVWRVLRDADPNDKLTVVEIAAVASAAAGQRIDVEVVQQMVRDLARDALVYRAGVRRPGKRTEQAYWLTATGQRRAVRLLGPA